MHNLISLLIACLGRKAIIIDTTPLLLKKITDYKSLLLMLQVSLGTCNELLAADYNADKLPKGKDSVWGKGKIGPDPSKEHVT